MKSALLVLLNNVFTNRILIWLGKDDLILRYVNNWAKVRFDSKRTAQENVGFSHKEDIDLAVQKVHKLIADFEQEYLTPESTVLDIGCGTGLYLKNFRSSKLWGTDLNNEFIEECKKKHPRCQFRSGDYLDISLPKEHFDLIYSVSVIEYIPPGKIKKFISKIHAELKPGGFLILQYPHAQSKKDKWFSDLSYVSYTPEYLESLMNGGFSVIKHEHSFDGRKVKGVDEKHYGESGKRNFCNGMFLLAKKSE